MITVERIMAPSLIFFSNFKFSMVYSIDKYTKTDISESTINHLNRHPISHRHAKTTSTKITIGVLTFGLILIIAITICVNLLNKKSTHQVPDIPTPKDINNTIDTTEIDLPIYQFIELTVSKAASYFKIEQKIAATTNIAVLKESFFLLYLVNSTMFEFVYIDIYRCAVSYLSQDYFNKNDKNSSLNMFKSEQLNTLWDNSELCRKWAYIFNQIVNNNKTTNQQTGKTAKFTSNENDLKGNILLGSNYKDYDTFDGIKSFFNLIYKVNESIFNSILGLVIDNNNNRGNVFEINTKNNNKITTAGEFETYVTKLIKENVLNLSSHAFFKFTGNNRLTLNAIKSDSLFKLNTNTLDLTPFNPKKIPINANLLWHNKVEYIEGIMNEEHVILFYKGNIVWGKRENKKISTIDKDQNITIEITSVGIRTWYELSHVQKE